MKTKLIILACATLALIAHAADITVTVPDQDVPRVQEAYGSILNLGRNATPAEVQKAIQDWLHTSTLDYERRKNTYLYTPPPMHFPTPTPTPAARAAEPAAAKAVPSPTATPKKKK